jgi:RimJ/RimL family protein N-acetyltransferase
MSVRRRCEARHDGAMQPTASAPRAEPDDGYGLRPVRSGDAPAVLAAFRSAADMARQGGVRTLEQAQEQVAWLRAPQRRAVAIVDAEDLLVGLVAISVDEENRSGWFFYWLHAEHRGRGLASRAAASVADRALTPSAEGGWGLERLELGHRVNNPASAAVARAAGFVEEGLERGKFLIDGERLDVRTCGRLRSDPPPPVSGLPWR